MKIEFPETPPGIHPPTAAPNEESIAIVLVEKAYLPERQHPEFNRVKNLLNKKYEAYRQSDHNTCKKSADDLQTLNTKISSDFPLDDGETYQLFNKLSNQVKLIADLELSAAYRLRDILRR